MNREVRRLFARLEHKVLSLIRIAIGPIKLGKLGPGEWRHLTPQEVKQLSSPSQ
jgi:16S rRNA U516 pseudouridylate synthase RsuA-like enzyme